MTLLHTQTVPGVGQGQWHFYIHRLYQEWAKVNDSSTYTGSTRMVGQGQWLFYIQTVPGVDQGQWHFYIQTVPGVGQGQWHFYIHRQYQEWAKVNDTSTYTDSTRRGPRSITLLHTHSTRMVGQGQWLFYIHRQYQDGGPRSMTLLHTQAVPGWWSKVNDSSTYTDSTRSGPRTMALLHIYSTRMVGQGQWLFYMHRRYRYGGPRSMTSTYI